MAFEKEIECPKCRSEKVETVPFLYKTLLSQNAGKKLMLDETFLKNTPELSEKARQRLLHRLHPPKEPKRTLPTGPIAWMAFLISWLTSGSLLIGRLGEKTYFISSALITALIAVPFYFILRLVIREFRQEHMRYRRLRAIWDKQYFCSSCRQIFIVR